MCEMFYAIKVKHVGFVFAVGCSYVGLGFIKPLPGQQF